MYEKEKTYQPPNYNSGIYIYIYIKGQITLFIQVILLDISRQCNLTVGKFSIWDYEREYNIAV